MELPPLTKPRLLIISPERIGHRMTAAGVRYWELAHALADDAAVTLLAPEPIDLPAIATLQLAVYRHGVAAALEPFLAASDLVLASGALLQEHRELAACDLPLVIDLAPPLPGERRTQQQTDIQSLTRQLMAGDFLVCTSERQHDLYLGMLLALDRLTPDLLAADQQLRTLVAVVPNGVPAAPPAAERRLRDVLPGVDSADPLLVWNDMLADWCDPLALVEALPQVIARHPQTRLVFLSGNHPADSQPMRTATETRARAAALGLTDRHVFFYDAPIAYPERATFLGDADIAVVLERTQREPAFAGLSPHFLDTLWAGLPVVVSANSPAAQLVAGRQLGRIVAPGEVAAIAAALTDLIDNPELCRDYAGHAHSLAAELTWQRAAAPLRDFCRRPRRSSSRRTTGPATTAPGDTTPTLAPLGEPIDQAARDQRARERDAARNAALEALRGSYLVRERPLPGGVIGRLRRLLVDQLLRPFVAPLLEQQNAHNAAVLRALDQLAANADERRSAFYADLDILYGTLERVHGAADARLTQLELIVGHNQAEISRLRDRAIDLDVQDTMLAERLAALQDRDRAAEEAS